MTQERKTYGPMVHKYTFDRDRFVYQTIIDGELARRVRLQTDDGMAMQLLAMEDAYARRHILDCFGKKATQSLTCPSTWWDHLKLTLKKRWPRLFAGMSVRLEKVTLETGAVLADIPEPVAAAHLVVPYVMDPQHFWMVER